MEIRVVSGRPVGIPRNTCLENVEADMTELEIDIEDIHYRKKMETECYEEEAHPYRKTDYKPIIIIKSCATHISQPL